MQHLGLTSRKISDPWEKYNNGGNEINQLVFTKNEILKKIRVSAKSVNEVEEEGIETMA